MIVDLYEKLRELKVSLAVVDGRLDISAPKGVLDAPLLEEIRTHKAALIALVQQYRNRKKAFVSIEQVAAAPSYPLSSSQQRLWVLSQFEQANAAYNIPSVYVFEGPLDVMALRQAFAAMISRHESLRTVFRQDAAGEIRQFIQSPEAVEFEINVQDFRNTLQKEQAVAARVSDLFTLPFNLAEGPLLRAGLFRIGENKWVFGCTLHHIISDGWSMTVLVKELLQYYNAEVKGGTPGLLPLPIHYKDYAVWQQAQLNASSLQAAKAYWLKQFEGVLPVLELPGDLPRPATKTYKGDVVSKIIDVRLYKEIKTLALEQGGTLFMGLLAFVNTLLYHYTGQEDIIVGSPVTGREHTDLENQIGLYLNMLPLRTRFTGNNTYRELLTNVMQVTMDAYEHQAYPFDELIDALNLRRDLSRHPLFDVAITLQQQDPLQGNLGGLTVSAYPGAENTFSKFDLSFNFLETEDGLNMWLEYNSDIYERCTAAGMVNHLEQLMRVVIAQPTLQLSLLDLLSPAEKEQLLVTFNDTVAQFACDKTLVALFEEQVAKTPGRPALVYADKELSFGWLNEQANRLAAWLAAQYKVQPGDLLAVKLERSEWMIVSILAVLKAGGAYIPIDPQYPLQRVEYMLADSKSKVLIDDELLLRFSGMAATYEAHNPPLAATPRDLAYVIYTSGSTGTPKGCMLEHRSVMNRIEWMWRHYGFCTDDVILQKTTFTFDVSVWEIFMPLCFGAKMVLCQKEDITSPERILSLVENRQVTCLHFVPGLLHQFMIELAGVAGFKKRISSLTRVITSGEPLLLDTLSTWYANVDIPVYNLYGPTEAAVDVSYYATSAADAKVLIGKPIWNTRIYITDALGQLKPAGVVGEICLSGIGLARGYLNKPEQTAAVFVNDPFVENSRMYRTGDLGRWLPNGNIEFMGRKDNQVKLRGYRIEPEEIMHAILQVVPDVKQAVVDIKPVNNEKTLVAYLVMEQEPDRSLLRARLAEKLPAYMIPSFFVVMDKIPLNTNGKIDRKALPSVAVADFKKKAYVAPGNHTEAVITQVWQEVLEVEQIGVTDNFFDLGGNSIKVVKMVSLVNARIARAITIVTAFRFPTVKELAIYLDAAGQELAHQEEKEMEEELAVMGHTMNILMHNRDEA